MEELITKLQKEIIELRDKVYDLNIDNTQLKNHIRKLGHRFPDANSVRVIEKGI